MIRVRVRFPLALCGCPAFLAALLFLSVAPALASWSTKYEVTGSIT